MEAMVSKPTKTLSGGQGHRGSSLYARISILRLDLHSGCYGRAPWRGLRSVIHARCFIRDWGPASGGWLRAKWRWWALGPQGLRRQRCSQGPGRRPDPGRPRLCGREQFAAAGSFRRGRCPQSTAKAEAARRKIAQFNSRTEVHAHVVDLVPSNIHHLLGGAAIVLDATDNFETRYLLNDYAVKQGRPWIYAAAVGAYAAT